MEDRNNFTLIPTVPRSSLSFDFLKTERMDLKKNLRLVTRAATYLKEFCGNCVNSSICNRGQIVSKKACNSKVINDCE